MSAALADALARARVVTAPGTDPALVLALTAATLTPAGRDGRAEGHGWDALRRRCRDATDSAGSTAHTPAERVAAAVGTPHPWTYGPAERVLARWGTLGVRVAVVGDPHYPARLAEGWPHADVPTLIAWRGVPPGEADVAVAIVGARRASGYGTGVAGWLAGVVARAGVRVVSGGALGVDAAAHEAAIEAPGGTTVVLGCGHAVAYPSAHARPGGLFDRVLDEGGTLVSEFLPDVAPRPAAVRARNRIVAGLADVVVVVEGAERSGALVTAGVAADLGRTVLAVPGDVRAPGSVAPHRLLAEGAGPCTGPDDVMRELGLATAGSVAAPGSAGVRARDGVLDGSGEGAGRAALVRVLPGPVADLLVERWPRPVDVDDLAARSPLPVPSLLAALTRARTAGLVVEGSDGVRLAHDPGRRR